MLSATRSANEGGGSGKPCGHHGWRDFDEQPFQQIKNGKKTVEVRLYDEKRRKIQSGNLICFTNTENHEKIRARVVKLHACVSFAELFERVGLDACGFRGYSIEEALDKMKDFYSVEEEQKYGVVGIEIQLIQG